MNWLGGAKKRLRMMGASLGPSDGISYKKKALKLSDGIEVGKVDLPTNQDFQDEVFNRFYYKEQLLPQFLKEKEKNKETKEVNAIELEIGLRKKDYNEPLYEPISSALSKKDPVSPKSPVIVRSRPSNHQSSGLLRRSDMVTRKLDSNEKTPSSSKPLEKKELLSLEGFKYRKKGENKSILYSEPVNLRPSLRFVLPNTDTKMKGVKDVLEVKGLGKFSILEESSKGQRKKVEFKTPKKKGENS